MRLRARTLFLLGMCLLSVLISIPATEPALAFPPLPSSFYGTVKVDGVNVPDGTRVQAVIAGVPYAEAATQTYQGESVYSLDIKGDDLDTQVVDGGIEGDPIVFMVGKETADQTGAWQGGTNTNLNLSVSLVSQAATSSGGEPTISAPADSSTSSPAAASRVFGYPRPACGCIPSYMDDLVIHEA